MKHYLNIVECAIEFDSKFLIIRRPKNSKHAANMLSFPGGKVEEIDEINSFDILRQAIKREVFEEVGLDLKEFKYITTSYFKSEDDIEIIDTIFYSKLNTLPQLNVSSREVAEYFWMTKEEIQQSVEAPIWLKKYFEYINYIM